jgi:hypothetical protein
MDSSSKMVDEATNDGSRISWDWIQPANFGDSGVTLSSSYLLAGYSWKIDVPHHTGWTFTHIHLLFTYYLFIIRCLAYPGLLCKKAGPSSWTGGCADVPGELKTKVLTKEGGTTRYKVPPQDLRWIISPCFAGWIHLWQIQEFSHLFQPT